MYTHILELFLSCVNKLGNHHTTIDMLVMFLIDCTINKVDY